MHEPIKVLVLYSGGKDSSATALEMARLGYYVTLFTFDDGTPEITGPHGDSAPGIRHQELMRAFPHKIDPLRVFKGNTYLLRKLALEKTNATHVVYPLALILNVVSDAILYCLEHGVKHIACGYTGYQGKEDRYIEQRGDFYLAMQSFVSEYGIEFHAPFINAEKKTICNTLEMYNVSANSLESKYIFSGIPFEVTKALDFWNESFPICRDYISYKRKAFQTN